MKKIYVLIIVELLSLKISFAQQGKNGAEVVSTTNTIVNEYAALTSNATAGSTSITVANDTLNTHNRFSAPLSPGDLIMIIQMQGADINGTAIDSTWGTVTDYNNCGLNEFAQVTGITGTTIINVRCPLQNSYTASGKVQVVRVPRYTTLTVEATDTLTCDTWNGITGGIIAAEVSDSTIINSGGVINATAKGFRGGFLINNDGEFGVTNFASSDSIYGAQKGESIAGFHGDYTAFGGMYCRGVSS